MAARRFSVFNGRSINVLKTFQIHGLNLTPLNPPGFTVRWSPLPCKWTPKSSLPGLFEKNLTVTRGFFQDHRLIKHWRFQAIYSLPTETLSDNFDVKVNDPPTDGSCSIDPKSGTLFTVFTIECVHWFDDDEIEEYSFYGLFSFSLQTEKEARISFSLEEFFVSIDVTFFYQRLDRAIAITGQSRFSVDVVINCLHPWYIAYWTWILSPADSDQSWRVCLRRFEEFILISQSATSPRWLDHCWASALLSGANTWWNRRRESPWSNTK